jgi:hypothetical protein
MNAARNVSLFTIVGEEDGKILTTGGGEFDVQTYSRFKYSDRDAAGRYGQMLTGTILGCDAFRAAQHHPDRVIVTASAYKQLPTAAQAVADSAIEALHGFGYPVRPGRIHRDTLTEGDYGNMSADERTYWMSRNGLWVDEAEFEGREVIVIDDVSISGAHGRSIVKMFESIDIASLTLVHVLKLHPELAARDPKIEDRMNHAVIKNLWDLRQLIRDCSGFTPNARTVKFILSQPPPQIATFMDSLPHALVSMIYEGVQADGYDRMRSYHEAADCIASHVTRRHFGAILQTA